MDFYSRVFHLRFFYNCDAKREIKDRAGPYGEFFEKVLDVGYSY